MLNDSENDIVEHIKKFNNLFSPKATLAILKRKNNTYNEPNNYNKD